MQLVEVLFVGTILGVGCTVMFVYWFLPVMSKKSEEKNVKYTYLDLTTDTRHTTHYATLEQAFDACLADINEGGGHKPIEVENGSIYFREAEIDKIWRSSLDFSH